MRRTKRPIIFLRAQIKEMNFCWRSEHGIADGKENCTAIGLHLAFTYNYNIYIYISYPHRTINHTAVRVSVRVYTYIV